MKQKLLRVLGIVPLMLFTFNVQAGTVLWEPTVNSIDDTSLENVNFLMTVLDPSIDSLILYDAGLDGDEVLADLDTTTNDLTLVTAVPTFDIISFSFTTEYIATSLLTTDTADLGDTPTFELALLLSDGSLSFVSDYVALADNWYLITFDSGVTAELQGVDLTPSPVPVPAAFWLFGSALFGMVSVGRRKLSA